MNKFIRGVIVVGLFLLSAFSLFGQVSKQGGVHRSPYPERKARSIFTTLQLPDDVPLATAVTQYIYNSNPNIAEGVSGLAGTNHREGPNSIHYTYEQTFIGLPVFRSQIKVNLNKKRQIKSVFDNSFSTADWDKAALQAQSNSLNVAALEQKFRTSQNAVDAEISSRKLIFALGDVPVVALELTVFKESEAFLRLYIIDAAMNILYDEDLARYQHEGGGGDDRGSRETVQGYVFLPDPLTTAEVEYGTPYIDANDTDVPVLNAERKLVTFEASKIGGDYILRNSFFEMKEMSAPNIPAPTSTVPSFNFTRGQDGFEDVNAFYHLSVYQQHMQDIGYGSLTTYLWVDAHAQNGADNSLFLAGSPHRLYFGEGGVDDAEDADVVVHEYGHSISYVAAPNTNSGHERQALDEALGDYIAVSYSRSLSEYNWFNVFSWDGHNPFFNGRVANSDIKYSDLNGSSYHLDGQLWSSVLMEIWELIGGDITDILVFESLQGYAQNMSMPDAAMLLLQADSALYQGIHICEIHTRLYNRELVGPLVPDTCGVKDPSVTAYAGKDTIICTGESVQLGSTDSIRPLYTYQWVPTDGLDSATSPTPIASPTQTTSYLLIATAGNMHFNLDTVLIQVDACRIRVLNTWGFYSGDGDLIIQFPLNSTSATVELFDMVGKKLFEQTGISAAEYTISGNGLPNAMYVLRVTSGSEKKVVKLVKATN